MTKVPSVCEISLLKRVSHRLISMKFASASASTSSTLLGGVNRRQGLEQPCSHRCFTNVSKFFLGKQRMTAVGTRTILNGNNRLRAYSSYEGNFLAKFSEEIDLDALREQKIKELKNNGINFHVHAVVKEILAEKCDEAIQNLSAEDEKKLQVIQLEHDFLFSEGYTIPSPEEMTSENWLQALNLTSKQRRLKYYLYWQKRKYRKESSKSKKATLKSESEVTGSSEEKENKRLDQSKILIRIYDSTMKRWLNHRLSASMQHGIPLVLDMDYGEHMSNREVRNTAEQLLDTYCLNRGDQQLPFHLHFTGCPANNPIYRLLQLQLQDDPHFMATVTPQSYLDLFDRDRLVYLSPNGRQVLREFDPDAVYIVGAFNDRATQQPISYARAKEQGIKCQRLPLDQYIQWNIGSKALTLNQVMSIMTAVKNKKSWLEAFRAVPSRKIRDHRKRS